MNVIARLEFEFAPYDVVDLYFSRPHMYACVCMYLIKGVRMRVYKIEIMKNVALIVLLYAINLPWL